MSVLVVYATVEGQTGKVAQFAETVARKSGLQTRLLDAGDPTAQVDFDGVDRVILAASVHERRHPKAFEVFLKAHRQELAVRRTLMLSVSLSAAFPEGREEAQDYLDEMLLRTELEPDGEMLVAGAIRGRSYDYFASQVIRHVVLRGRDVDPNVQEHEFTDWNAVEARLKSFLAAQTAGAGV